jgi:hypothetical protein
MTTIGSKVSACNLVAEKYYAIMDNENDDNEGAVAYGLYMGTSYVINHKTYYKFEDISEETTEFNMRGLWLNHIYDEYWIPESDWTFYELEKTPKFKNAAAADNDDDN